jgi:uncharacterized membrane protein (UPF0182 family)
LQLPGEREPEFSLQRSFTPRRKGGILSSFMFARNDGENYGKLVQYTVSGENAPSGAQAATAIDSDPFISSQFTLLGQAGSKVEKGSVQLIPIGSGVMYVRPIWVTGSTPPPYPRFRFVAAVAGDRAVMGCDVEDAVTALRTGEKTKLQQGECGQENAPVGPVNPEVPGGVTTTVPSNGTTPTTTPGSTVPLPSDVPGLLALADREFAAAQTALRDGDLSEYQRHVNLAEAAVRKANALVGESATSTTRPSTTTTAP